MPGKVHSQPIDHIGEAILPIRGQRVLLDSTLAKLYGIETRALVQAVNRNAARFPDDFCFRLTEGESRALRSQTGDGLSISVERVAIAGDPGSKANEGL